MTPTKLPGSESGTLPGSLPYARAGGGQRALAVLPGFGDAMWPGVYPPVAGYALAPYFARYLRTHTVYLLSRPRGLPSGFDEDDAVAVHVPAFERMAERHTGVDAMGISMGGLIGQELARPRPDLIDRLVLANTACRLDEDAYSAVHRMKELAHEHDWAGIRSELATALYADLRAVAYPPLLQTVGRFTLPHPTEPADVWQSLEFILDYDGCEQLGDIDRPTLVFGGERDPYFTERLLSETAAGIPDAELTVVPGAKHGAFHERKTTFDSRVLSFFRRPARSDSPRTGEVSTR